MTTVAIIDLFLKVTMCIILGGIYENSKKIK